MFILFRHFVHEYNNILFKLLVIIEISIYRNFIFTIYYMLHNCF